MDSNVSVSPGEVVVSNILYYRPPNDCILMKFLGDSTLYGERWYYDGHGDVIDISSLSVSEFNGAYSGKCLVEMIHYARSRSVISSCYYIDSVGNGYICSLDFNGNYNSLIISVSVDGEILPYNQYYQLEFGVECDDSSLALYQYHNRIIGISVLIVSICTLFCLAVGRIVWFLVPYLF
jgi:hypothetical protein